MVLQKLNKLLPILVIGEVHLCWDKLMGGNTGEIQIGSERGLYKYINHQAGTTKASTGKIILVQMYSIFRLLIGVPDYSSEVIREKQKLVVFIVILSQRGVCKS